MRLLSLTIFILIFTATAVPSAANEFFALENAVRNDAEYNTIESQAAILRELGYDGMGPSHCTGVEKKLEELKRQGLKLSAIYCRLTVEKDATNYNPRLEKILPLLGKNGSLLWLNIVRGSTCPNGTKGDETTARAIRRLADLGKPHGLKIAIYPHSGFYIATLDDTMRIAKKIDRKNVGLTFNLCHHLRCGNSENVESYLEKVRPMLFCVTINGADNDGSKQKDWSKLIQPLGEGTFDVTRVLKTLKRLDYQGPIGLQCYNVPGTAREKLTKSMKAWKQFQAAESLGN